MKRIFVIALVALLTLMVATAQQTGTKKTGGDGRNSKMSHQGGMKPGGMKMEDHKVWAPDQLQWGPAPALLPAGAQLAVLEGDPMKPGEFTMRLKMPAGYKIPPHFHHKMEHVTVVSGALKVGMGDKFDESQMGEIAPGSFAWIKPGTRHFAMAKGDTVIQLHGSGPWSLTYVNPQDDPRKKK